MDPPKLFDMERPSEVRYLVFLAVPARPHEVLVTVGSGLFVQVPQPDSRLPTREFYEAAAASINVTLCDFALAGQVSAAASPVQMGVGFLDDGEVTMGIEPYWLSWRLPR